MRNLALTVVGLLFNGLAHATPLSDAAAGMEAGTWARLQTSGLLTTGGATNVFVGEGNTATAMTECDEMRWDPFSRQLFFQGGDHNGPAKLIVYSEQNNDWVQRDDPSTQPWMVGTNHGYDNSAIDPERGKFYHLLFDEPHAEQVYEYNIANRTWSTNAIPPLPSDTTFVSCCGGVEVFPDFRPSPGASAIDALVITTDDGVAYYDLTNRPNQWVRLAGSGQVQMGPIRSVSEYSRIHKVMIFGGANVSGQGYRQMNMLTDEGVVSRLPDAPFTMGINESILTVDPVSGDFLILREAVDELWVYKPDTQQWNLLQRNVPLRSTMNEDNQVLAASIDTYGVVMFLTCDYEDRCDVHLYKHAPSTIDTSRPSAPTGFKVM